MTNEPENYLMVRYIIVISLYLSEGFHINIFVTYVVHVLCAQCSWWFMAMYNETAITTNDCMYQQISCVDKPLDLVGETDPTKQGIIMIFEFTTLI